MAPPKKPSRQKPSTNCFKGNKESSSEEEYYKSKTKFVKKSSDNLLGVKSVAKQLDKAPSPRDTGKSGYPHKFENLEGQISQLVSTDSATSSTTSLFEFPMSPKGKGKAYNYATKPKENPGHLRVITNQNKRFKGVIAHEGEKNNPNIGPMHSVKKRAKAALDKESDEEPEEEPEDDPEDE